MIAVAQDARGEELVGPVVQDRSIGFPVLIDRRSHLARIIGFRIVPSGVFIDSEGMVRYRHTDDFDFGDPRLRVNLDRFLAGGEVKPILDREERMDPRALELFAQGVSLYAAGRERNAVSMWRRALELDPDNFVIRSQIWTVEHPEHFYPAVDRSWQVSQLLKEGYDKPLP
jgi:hypothetical protein